MWRFTIDGLASKTTKIRFWTTKNINFYIRFIFFSFIEVSYNILSSDKVQFYISCPKCNSVHRTTDMDLVKKAEYRIAPWQIGIIKFNELGPAVVLYSFWYNG